MSSARRRCYPCDRTDHGESPSLPPSRGGVSMSRSGFHAAGRRRSRARPSGRRFPRAVAGSRPAASRRWRSFGYAVRKRRVRPQHLGALPAVEGEAARVAGSRRGPRRAAADLLPPGQGSSTAPKSTRCRSSPAARSFSIRRLSRSRATAWRACSSRWRASPRRSATPSRSRRSPAPPSGTARRTPAHRR
jgi:hypothetical protein